MGNMHKDGYGGLQQDNEKAFEWWKKAAKQGVAHAQCNLGFMYHNGHGVDVNYKKAIEWYEKAAKQGYAEAQSDLGGMTYSM